jgi:RHS repeat-associated protein
MDGRERVKTAQRNSGASTTAAVLGAIFGLLLLLSTGIALAADDGDSPSPPAAELSAPPQPEPGVEVPADRTATSDTFLLPDGSREARIYGAPVNYQAPDGGWEPIEDGLEEAAGGAVVNGANSFDLRLPPDLDNEAVRLAIGDVWISERPLQTATDPVDLERETATYPGEGSGPSFEFIGLADGLKENIELSSPSAPSSFYFRLEASGGLTPSIGESGAVEFRDPEEELVASIPAPAMHDSARVPAVSSDVHYSLEAAGGGWTLGVHADDKWLSNPERRWPIELDPTVTVPAPTLDCEIFSGSKSENTVCGTSGWPSLGVKAVSKSSGSDEYARTLMRFNLSAIPVKEASISSAKIGIYAPAAARNTAGVELWNVNNKAWDSSVTWKYWAKHSTWETEGGDYGQGQPKSILINTAERGSQEGWWNFTGQGLAWMVQRWVSGETPNQGVLLKLIDEKSHSCSPSCIERAVDFSSSATANKPYLSVEYIPEAPGGSKVTSPTDGTRSAKRFTLSAAWSHSGVTGVTFQYKGEEGWTNIPEAKVIDKNNQTVKWPVAVEAGAHKSEPLYWNAVDPSVTAAIVKHKLRAVLSGSAGAGGYTEPVEVELNRDIGGAKDATTSVGPGTLDLLTGNLAVARTDVAIPGFGSALEFSRSHNSRDAKAEEKGVLGQGWRPTVPVEEAGGAAWRSVKEKTVTETYEGESFTYAYMMLSDLEGVEYGFEINGENFTTPPELTGYVLARLSPTQIALTDPDGNRTVFDNGGAGSEYLPVSVAQTGGPGNKTRMVYEIVNGNRRLKKVIAPAPQGVICSDESATLTPGCHVLTFSYQSGAAGGWEAGLGDRLSAITYYAATSETTMGSWEVANYSYDSKGRLVAEWDPRISPALKETYSYEAGGQLHTITPPGQEPWTLEYGTVEGETPDGRLVNVKRASLLESPSFAQTTIAYGVPVSGSGAPYDLSPSAVAQWGQQDLPTDATAIFPPNEVPASPPSSYARASVYYMDAEGMAVNTATPAGAGTESARITTAETDQFGNVVRELSAQNRLRALAAGAGSVAKSHELETKRVFSADGTEMREEWGPMHLVRLESGTSTQARLYKTVSYDEGAPEVDKSEPMPHLPTKETAGALVGANVLDQGVTEHRYNWTLRKPTETIVDPSGLNIRTITAYDTTSGLPVETRQPSNPEGGGAGTTKIFYYSGEGSSEGPCEKSSRYAGLVCKVTPAAQPGAGQPQLLVSRIAAYSPLGQPTEILESPGGSSENVRKTTLTYDAAGRQLTKKTEGGGTAIPKTQTVYNPTMGAPTTQRFICESECTNYQYSTAIGTTGTGNGQFSHPADIVADGKGNVWVVDKANNRIEEFNEKGEFVRAAGSFGSAGGQLSSPAAIAIDTWGNLDVADTGNNRVVRFSETGAFVSVVGANVNKTKVESGGTQAEKNRCTAESGNVCQAGTAGSGEGLMSEPLGIATSAGDGGNFYVVERANNRVEKFNLQGELLAKFGSSGSGAGQLKEPTAIAIAPNGYLWVTDTGNNRIEEWTSSWAFLRSVGSEGSGNGQFKAPAAIDVDAESNVFVGEKNNQRVQELSASGEYISKFGSAGAGQGQFAFSIPMGLAVTGRGEIWVADTDHDRVQKWVAGFDDQATTTTYDALGRPTAYEDADGNKASTTYDLLGRPVTTSDGKGTQIATYDATSGLLTKLEDSAAGTFTAAYDADGNLTERTLPDGLTAKTTYDETGSPIHLTYTKASSCGTSCTWLDEGLERSVYGQVLNQTGTLAAQQYSYDKAGRLTLAKETPAGGSCTTRSYSYDKDSNRTQMITRAPGIGGVCSESGGTTQSYEYDTADRLLGSGLTYDSFGRITSLPAEFAGGKTLTTSYFSNDMVATQTQNGVTNSFTLDAALRQRSRLQGGGGLEGTEVFHYAGPGDAPAWTERGSAWTRNIVGIGGELCAVQESSAGTTLQLTNLHGDVVATASPSPTETKLKATFRFDEFGNPVSGSAGRFGWLGGKQRRTELASGVIQMGARSYVPEIGRFISTDPVAGGSANTYDYANADPVNEVDLGGTCPKKRCLGIARRVSRPAARTARLAKTSSPSATASRPACSWSGSATDQRLFLSDGEAFHVVSGEVHWSCTVEVKVYAWMKVGGAPTPPQPFGPSKAGHGVVAGIPYGGYEYLPLVMCIKFIYQGRGKKQCGPIAVTYEN